MTSDDFVSLLIGIGAGLFAVIAVRVIDAIMEKKK
jgi:hypothetical protein